MILSLILAHKSIVTQLWNPVLSLVLLMGTTATLFILLIPKFHIKKKVLILLMSKFPTKYVAFAGYSQSRNHTKFISLLLKLHQDYFDCNLRNQIHISQAKKIKRNLLISKTRKSDGSFWLCTLFLVNEAWSLQQPWLSWSSQVVI